MNERILEILNQSGLKLSLDEQVKFQRAAKLIVQECAELVETQHTWITSVAASALIRKHFGVEE